MQGSNEPPQEASSLIGGRRIPDEIVAILAEGLTDAGTYMGRSA